MGVHSHDRQRGRVRVRVRPLERAAAVDLRAGRWLVWVPDHLPEAEQCAQARTALLAAGAPAELVERTFPGAEGEVTP